LFREEVTSALADSHAGPLSWSNWNLEMLFFVEGRDRRTRRKTLGARQEPATNSSHIWHRQARALTTAPSLPFKKSRWRSIVRVLTLWCSSVWILDHLWCDV